MKAYIEEIEKFTGVYGSEVVAFDHCIIIFTTVRYLGVGAGREAFIDRGERPLPH